MNVASLELCKELYELSGWGYTDSSYQDTGTDQFENYELVGEVFNTKENGSTGIPAYDLGYLLRKLPADLGIGTALAVKNLGPVWCAYYEYDGKYPSPEADTPEDAACKLCIELFKQGVLK